MKTYQQIIDECLESVGEIFPWDLEEKLESSDKLILLDIREPEEFQSINCEIECTGFNGIQEIYIF